MGRQQVRLQAPEIRYLRRVKGVKRVERKINGDMRRKCELSEIQSIKVKQNISVDWSYKKMGGLQCITEIGKENRIEAKIDAEQLTRDYLKQGEEEYRLDINQKSCKRL